MQFSCKSPNVHKKRAAIPLCSEVNTIDVVDTPVLGIDSRLRGEMMRSNAALAKAVKSGVCFDIVEDVGIIRVKTTMQLFFVAKTTALLGVARATGGT
jgi:hypothetical protein